MLKLQFQFYLITFSKSGRALTVFLPCYQQKPAKVAVESLPQFPLAAAVYQFMALCHTPAAVELDHGATADNMSEVTKRLKKVMMEVGT